MSSLPSTSLDLNPLGPNSVQDQFSPYNYPYTVKGISYENQKNDHPREFTLIFEQILSTNSLRKCMEISLENLYVDARA